MTTQLESDGSPTTTATAAARTHTPHRVEEPFRVAPERYYSPEFAAWEREKLWRHCWQVACRAEEIPRAGDFTEYEITGQSILVVRQDDGSVKAYFNACRHRATALGAGTGEFLGGQIVCPYHGWRWNLDGESTHVYAAKGFRKECLDPDFLRLRECRSVVSMGLVFVNLDPNGPEFADTVGHFENALAPIGLDRMRVRWWRYAVLPANWKIAQEAFMEAYHVQQAHPSLAMGAGDDDFDNEDAEGYEILPGGNAHMVHATLPLPPGMTQAEHFTRYNWAMHHGTGAYPTEREMFVQTGLQERKIPDDQFIGAFFQELYNYAEGAGIPLPPPSTDTVGFGHAFPNITVLSQYGNALMYRSRPNGDDPESCIFDVWALQIPSADDEPGRPTREGPIPMGEWPQILKEDFSNIAGQQKGLRTDGMDTLLLSERYEPMIINNHQEIDRYLGRF